MAKNVRINKHDREMIVRSFMTDIYGDQQAKLQTRIDEIVEAAVNGFLGKDRKAFEALPDRLKRMRQDVYVRAGSSGYSDYLRHSQGVFVPDAMWSPRASAEARLKKGSKADKNFEKLLIERRDSIAERSKLANEIMATLKQFRTLKKLLEAWPEVQKHLPKHLTDPQHHDLPVVSVSQVKKHIAEATKKNT